MARRLPQRSRSSPAGRWRVSRWSRIWPVAVSRRVRCPVIRMGRAQPPREPTCRARGARCPAAASLASLAVSRPRRSSAESRFVDASAGPECTGAANVRSAGEGNWSCAGMGTDLRQEERKVEG